MQNRNPNSEGLTPLTEGQMEEIVVRLKREGRFPSPEKLLEAISQARRKFRNKILRAREQGEVGQDDRTHQERWVAVRKPDNTFLRTLTFCGLGDVPRFNLKSCGITR